MNTRFLETDVRTKGLHQRLLQLPMLTFGRGTAPQRAVEEILGKMAKLAMVPLEQSRITCSPSVAADGGSLQLLGQKLRPSPPE